MKNWYKECVSILLILVVGCAQVEKTDQSLKVSISRVLLNIDNDPDGNIPPTIELKMECINNTSEDIILSFSDKYSEKTDSRLIMINLITNQLLFVNGLASTEIKRGETISFTTNIDIWNNEGDFFNISEEFLKRRDYSNDVDYLFEQIRQAFKETLVILYLDSKDANHLNPVNQANEYFTNDNVILVKWADDLKYEIYEAEEPPSPQDLPQY